MKIDNEFTVSVPIDQAWGVLTDLEGIAPCLPGAQLTGSDGDTFRGKVKIKIGPVVTEYAGTAAFVEKDDNAHRAVIGAKGRESRGAGNAAAVITAQLRPDGERTVVNIDTDLKVSGKVAQLGSSMIQEVSKKLIGQFVESLEGKLVAERAVSVAAAVEAQPESKPVAPTLAEPEPEPAPAPRPAPDPEPAPAPEPLDLMGLAGAAAAKRLTPVVVGAAAVVAVVIWLVVRWPRRRRPAELSPAA